MVGLIQLELLTDFFNKIGQTVFRPTQSSEPIRHRGGRVALRNPRRKLQRGARCGGVMKRDLYVEVLPVIDASPGAYARSDKFARFLQCRPVTPRMRSAAFSPIIIEGALVLPLVTAGMIEASATRRPSIP
jgi:hypothetical protein